MAQTVIIKFIIKERDIDASEVSEIIEGSGVFVEKIGEIFTGSFDIEDDTDYEESLWRIQCLIREKFRDAFIVQ